MSVPAAYCKSGLQLDLALIHYPVVNKNGEIIGSAVTNLDIHDIARACRTYGVGTFYLVTPYADQQEMIRELLAHWLVGYGATYNAKRKEALSCVRLVSDLGELNTAVRTSRQAPPLVLATGARQSERLVGFSEARAILAENRPMLLLFGTGWGLAPEVMSHTAGSLPPITGGTDYNHLSVRSAVSIVLDRLLGERD